MDNIDHKETKEIIEHFKHICQIPHGSKNYTKILEHIIQWCSKNEFQYEQDDFGNLKVIVIENEQYSKVPIIIQAHVDMVCTKTTESQHDFDSDPIEIDFVDEGDVNKTVITAKQTSLGADNGIGLSTALLIAEQIKSEKLKVDRSVYLLFTLDEEIGLVGASKLGKYPFMPEKAFIINTDGENQHELCIGSAGGSIANIKFELDEIIDNSKLEIFDCSISNLKGGHSGRDIDKTHGNAIKIMAQFAEELKQKSKYHVFGFSGGNAQNAIASDAKMFFGHHLDEEHHSWFKTLNSLIKDANELYDEKIGYAFGFDNPKYYQYPKLYNFDKVIQFICELDHGILKMDPDVPTLVSASTNIGFTKLEGNVFTIECMTRASTDEDFDEYYSKLASLCDKYGAVYTEPIRRSGWEASLDEPFIQHAMQVHKEKFGKDPRIYKSHCGLESGELINHYPDWKCISIGAEIEFPHSTREYVTIDSIKTLYEWIVALIET
jgi:dipeptidase D